MLTNSSISQNSIDIPLQNTLNQSTNSAAASKAINQRNSYNSLNTLVLTLQEKLKVVERENTFLREIVATNEQKKNLEQSKESKIEELKQEHLKEMQCSFQREQDLETRLSSLQIQYSQMQAYTDACNLKIQELENVAYSNNSAETNQMMADLQITPENFKFLIDKISEYESVINELEYQKTESLGEIDQMKHQIDMFSQSLHHSKSESSNLSKIGQDGGIPPVEKFRKMQKESKRLKDQLFKQKKDFEQKVNNLKRKHKIDVDGYKQE